MNDSRKHPYQDLPSSSFWRLAVSECDPSSITPLLEPELELMYGHAIAAIGSCFAQHISRRLRAEGVRIFQTEMPHPLIHKEITTEFFYDIYPARYGNLYTCRQLLQLFERAYNLFQPEEDIWRNLDDTAFVDPFRPTIQPGGYWSKEDYYLSREVHFRAVREMFEKMDVLIFTMGLSECWTSNIDGAVYPVCPGVAGGAFDQEKYSFINQRVADVVGDMRKFLALLEEVNPKAKLILTVSPVNMIATYENRHVVQSSVCSKSILRAACDELTRDFSNVVYFPSYEIIVSSYTQGRYYDTNFRTPTNEAVDFVVSTFINHFFGNRLDGIERAPEETSAFAQQLEAACRVICDDELLDPLA